MQTLETAGNMNIRIWEGFGWKAIIHGVQGVQAVQ